MFHDDFMAFFDDAYPEYDSVPEYDAASAYDSHDGSLIGDPFDDAAHWHLQERSDTCAIAAQESVLEDLTGLKVTEEELTEISESHGWYTPGEGTAMHDVGKLLEYFDVPVEQHEHAGFDLIENALAEGDSVIVGVSAEELYAPADPDASPDASPRLKGRDADHAVQVIGVDRSVPDAPEVILNDPGIPDGRAVSVPLEAFQQAWDESGDFAVIAEHGDAHGGHPDRGGRLEADDRHDEPRLGTSLRQDGLSEDGNPVSYSTSWNAYFDDKTGEEVTPK